MSKWITVLDENYTLSPFMVSERWWSKLPNDIKSEVKQSIMEATVVNRVLDQRDETALRKVWSDRGVKVIDGDRPAFRAVARELYPRFAKMLGPDEKWLKWIDEVGEAFPIKDYNPLKIYGVNYKF